MRICVLLPTLNEENGIIEVIENMPNPVVDKIVIIDGHSSDKTIYNAESMRVHSEIETMYQEGEGKGMAFQTFLKNFDLDSHDVYIMLDADGTYDPKEMEKIIFPIVNKEADVVMGNRLCDGGTEAMNSLTLFGNKALTFISNVLYNKKTEDLCTGYWAFSKDFLKSIKIDAKGFDLEANLFTQAVKKKFRIKSVPISYGVRLGKKKLKYKHGFLIFKRLIKERF